MMELFNPDYDRSILSVSNSIIKHYGAAAYHKTLPELDRVLAKDFRNVVFIVLDGMGSNILDGNLPENSFFRRYRIADISSVFPPTTTAALTALESGLSPIEHGWLGWSCYFKEIDKNIDLYKDNNIVNKLLGFKNIGTLITEADDSIKTYQISPFSEYYADGCDAMCTHIENICNGGGEGMKFISAYHFRPDYDVHDFGCFDGRVKELLEGFEKRAEVMCGNLKDSLVIITADHGLTDIENEYIEDYPQIAECLKFPPSIEPRCLSFFIWDEYTDVFADRFNAVFGGGFALYPKEGIIGNGLFGDGTPHAKSLDFIGDFVAVAVGNTSIGYCKPKEGDTVFKAAHAGLTRDEMVVPLIVIEA